MTRRTLVSAAEAHDVDLDPSRERGSLKIFFGYAPCSGTTAAMLDEAQGLTAAGRDVYVADASAALDLDQIIKRRPDLVALGDLALANAPGSRNRTRCQDAEELLRAGIDVYATLRVADLQNEQDRVVALGLEPSPEPVPDYMLYGASQLEFVDIDPVELMARAKQVGFEAPESVLNELRILALRCVSEYASSVQMAVASREAGGVDPASPYSRVVAVVQAGRSPGRVLLEVTHLAASRADVEVVCVRIERRAGSRRTVEEDAAYASLDEQVTAMGLTLTTLYGEDPAEVVRDYIRTRGASDAVLARSPRPTWASRLRAPFQPSFEERAVEGLAGVNVHLVADDAPLTAASGRVFASLGGLRPRDLFYAAAFVLAAFLLARFMQAVGFGDAVSYVLFMASFVATAAVTRSYIAGFVAVAAGCLLQDYFFVGTYLDFSIDHRASFLVFATFIAVAAGTVAAVVGLSRAADRAARRERRTQALFDLNRSLVYAHGTAEVAAVALDAVTRLFGRSAALYLDDPFAPPQLDGHDRRAPVVLAVDGDVDAPYFERLTEQAVAHWVFGNGEAAGSGTDTHAASYVCYLPLAPQGDASGPLEGVLAVSAVRPLDLAERSFLELVASQVAQALERQSLAAKHRVDLQAMRATNVRSAFEADVLRSANLTATTVHALLDLLAAADDDDGPYRDALLRVVSDESARGRLMVDRMRAVLAAPVVAHCDVRAEVAAAVDDVREGLAGKVIDLEPGDPVPVAGADAALVRAATRFILEAAASYVGPRGIVQVSVTAYPDRVNVVVADDRPPSMGVSRAAAFALSTKDGGSGELSYERDRSDAMLAVARDRETVANQHAFLAALAHAMRLPDGAVRSENDRDSLNRQRIMRFDRLEYGLYMAALVVAAHGGTIKQRYRLGGGTVVTFTLPRD